MGEVENGLTPELDSWITQVTGAKTVRSQRLFGGGSRVTVIVDTVRPDGAALPLVLRLEGGGSHSGTSFSLQREFHVYRALEGRGVPVPRAYGLMGDGGALLLERLEGTSEFREMAAEDQPTVARKFLEALGRLHAIEARDLDLPGFELPNDPTEHATVDLGRWEELARSSCWDEPLVRFAFAALKAQAPTRVQRTVLVQGDTGPGNFMALPDRITGVIDWEFSHVGDPMDDFGWLKSRSGDQRALFEAAYPFYEEISGIRIEPVVVNYYHRMAILRCAVTVALGKAKGGALGVIPYRVAFQTYLARLADLMVEDAGLVVERDVPPSSQPAPSPLYSEGKQELRNFVLTEVKSRRGRIAAQSAITALTCLELKDRFGDEIAQRDHADFKAVFGALSPASLADEADRAGGDGDPAILGYLARRAWRERSLWPR